MLMLEMKYLIKYYQIVTHPENGFPSNFAKEIHFSSWSRWSEGRDIRLILKQELAELASSCTSKRGHYFYVTICLLVSTDGWLIASEWNGANHAWIYPFEIIFQLSGIASKYTEDAPLYLMMLPGNSTSNSENKFSILELFSASFSAHLGHAKEDLGGTLIRMWEKKWPGQWQNREMKCAWEESVSQRKDTLNVQSQGRIKTRESLNTWERESALILGTFLAEVLPSNPSPPFSRSHLHNMHAQTNIVIIISWLFSFRELRDIRRLPRKSSAQELAKPRPL